MAFVICLVVALVVSLVVCSSFSKQLKTAEEKTEADFYMEPGSLRLTQREDRFVNTTRTVIQSDANKANPGGPAGHGGRPGHGGPGFGGPGHGGPGFGGPGFGGPGGHGRH